MSTQKVLIKEQNAIMITNVFIKFLNETREAHISRKQKEKCQRRKYVKEYK